MMRIAHCAFLRRDRHELIAKTAFDVFPVMQAEVITAADRRVFDAQCNQDAELLVRDSSANDWIARQRVLA
jgi:hypothetical protein